MIQINPREVAAEALMEIMMADAYNTMTLRRLLRQNGAMSRQDRALCDGGGKRYTAQFDLY